ncbi:MAG: hypothetical protein ACM3XM_11360 [Mycobacterium leprae]
MSNIGIAEIMMIFLIWLVPIGVAIWVLVMATRAVKALESVADSLRQRNQP